MKRVEEKGITLIALVVTIVVILILAGITIQTAIGDGGIIGFANKAKEEQIIATYKDRISIVGMNWSIKRALDDSVTVEVLWQDMQYAKIIEDKDRDVEKLDENGNYIITVPEGYKFQIHINEHDNVEIDYVGKENNLLPYIQDITVVSQTSNSVELEVSVSRLNGGSLSYYYKVKGEPDESYQVAKENTTDLTVKIEGLTAKTTYEIKVTAENENGTAEKTTEVLIGELKGTINQKGETEWSNGKATIHLETETQNVSIMYQINGIEGTYLPYDDAQGITNLEHGDKVYAVLSDGSNITDYTSIDILDKKAPTVTVAEESKTSNSITVKVSSSDAEWGMPSTPTYNYYIKTTGSNYLATASHTGTETSYTFTGLTQNTSYDVKVTTSDKAGNVGEGEAKNITTEIVGGATGDLQEGNIIASEPTWSGGQASITLSKGKGVASNLSIEYQVGGVAEGKWTRGTSVTGLSHNTTVYARLTDGINVGSYASVVILDEINPQQATISLSNTSTTTTGSVSATVTHKDNESGVNISSCKWIYNTQNTAIGTNLNSYTNTFSSNTQQITLSTTTAGTYYLHVLTVDVAGNKTETISNSVTVEKAVVADGSFSEEKGVNTPDLADGKLTPIKWVDGNVVETTADDPDWYSYTTTDKKWANAITEDGSMWVWIPRYAYQISSLYHSGSSTGGTINIKFMQGTSNIAADGTSTWDNTSGSENWNIHPGFNYSSTALGLWVAKFEASRSDATSSSVGSVSTIKIQPGVQSWRHISVDSIYSTCLNYDSNTLGDANLNSHMMKNTEWGAVAYLAQSSYGKNTEVWINPNSNYITGQAGSSVSASSTTSTSAYNSGNGPQASTTGNVYGVYDMSGGVDEYTAAYVNNGNECLTSNGSSLVNGANYTKDVYTNSGDHSQSRNYDLTASKYGDALYETTSGSVGLLSWYSDYLNYPEWDDPFFTRGGDCYDSSSAGLFRIVSFYGYGDRSIGFRPVLVTL